MLRREPRPHGAILCYRRGIVIFRPGSGRTRYAHTCPAPAGNSRREPDVVELTILVAFSLR